MSGEKDLDQLKREAAEKAKAAALARKQAKAAGEDVPKKAAVQPKAEDPADATPVASGEDADLAKKKAAAAAKAKAAAAAKAKATGDAATESPANGDDAKAKAWFASKSVSVNYQLATPDVTTHPKRIFKNGVAATTLECLGANTTLMQSPIAVAERKPDASNQITLPGTETLVSLYAAYRNDGTIDNPTWVDVKDSATLNTATRIVTITGADQTKDYFVVADVNPSESTIATILESHPIAV
jgi:hypothetical protein